MKSKKNVLIITEDLYPHMNANSEIAYRIAEELQNSHNCDVTILGNYARMEDADKGNPFSIRTISLSAINDYRIIFEQNVRLRYKLAKALFKPRTLGIWRHLRKKAITYIDDCVYENECVRIAKKELKSKKYDCIIGFVRPEYIRNVMYRLGSSVPSIIYKLDPFVVDYQKLGEEDKKLIDRADNMVGTIFATDIIFSEYYQKINRDNISKVVVVGFPNIFRPTQLNHTIMRQSEKIRCVFAGAFYKGIREPEYTFRLFERLALLGIELHIFGRMRDGLELPQNMPSNIFFHGEVSSEEAMNQMQSADVLVNVGNSITTMLPSKLLTYISAGRPILNRVC